MPQNSSKIYRYIGYGVVIFAAALIEYTPFMVPIFGVYPSPLLISVIIVGVLEKNIPAGIFGLFAGIFADVYSVNGNGIHAIIYMLTALICSLCIARFFQRNIVSLSVVAAASLLVNSLCDALTQSEITSGFLMHYVNNGLLSCLINFCFIFPVFAVFIGVMHIRLSTRKPSGIAPKKLKSAQQDTHKFKKDY